MCVEIIVCNISVVFWDRVYVSILHRFRFIMIYFPKFTRSRDSEHTHVSFGGNLSCAHLVQLCVNQYTAFAVPSFTYSKDTIGDHFF